MEGDHPGLLDDCIGIMAPQDHPPEVGPQVMEVPQVVAPLDRLAPLDPLEVEVPQIMVEIHQIMRMQ